MKLNAPPPPPPPPEPEQPTPAANPPETTAASPPATEPAPPPPAKPVTWPNWFLGADVVLAVLAVIFAFLVSSFTARNSDIWLHLATGKRLLAGEYTPGSDPFSYVDPARPWVNHSWLFDVGAFLLYSGNGGLLVALKALAVAAAFGLLIAIRRPGFALWPWAAIAVVAAIAAAPRLQLSSVIASVPLLAITLYLLFRMPHRPGSWRFPIAIGITFWFWANLDTWFILGPLTLALVLIGELIDRRFRKLNDAGTTPADEPLGRVPDVPTLAKALAIGVLACMLNPHHFRVWELPFELIGAKGADADPRLKEQLLLSPLNKFYAEQPGLGNNLNGLAYAVLFVGGGAIIGLGAGRVRLSHIVLWVGFALLSLASVHAITFFAIVAVPLVASQLNGISSWAKLKNWGDPVTKLLLLGSAGGRVACLVATLVFCVLAWPGWMQPGVGGSPYLRRVAWAIEPDPALVRVAEQLETWHQAEQLRPDSRGVIATLELANYCSWYAPSVKVYFNGRFNYHRTELPNYVALRSSLGLLPQDEAPDARKANDLLEKLDAEYVAFHTGPGYSTQLRRLGEYASARIWLDPDRWATWYLDGRSVVSGWRPNPGAGKPSFDQLRLNPIARAFGRNVQRLPLGVAKPTMVTSGWESDFLSPIPFPPIAADEALGWMSYKDRVMELQQVSNIVGLIWSGLSPEPTGQSFHRFAVTMTMNSGFNRYPPRYQDVNMAISFIALRAAREAIAANPDHPDGYFALARVVEDPDLPMSECERTVTQITALRQCLLRLPPPEAFRKELYRCSPVLVASRLAWLYMGRPVGPRPTTTSGLLVNDAAFQPLSMVGATGGFYMTNTPQPEWFPPSRRRQLPQGAQIVDGPFLLPLDMARDAAQLAEKYAAVDTLPDAQEDQRRRNELKTMVKGLEDELARANQGYEREMRSRGANQKLFGQFESAIRANLIGSALQLLNDNEAELDRELGQQKPAVIVIRCALELATGRLEDAVSHLEYVTEDAGFQRVLADPQFRQLYMQLVYQLRLQEGNYADAATVIQDLSELRAMMSRTRLDRDAPPTPLQATMKPEKFIKAGNVIGLHLEVGIALGSVTPLDYLGKNQMAGTLLEAFSDRRQGLQRRREELVEFYYRRGRLLLLEGNIPEARKWLELTRQKGVPEWGVPDIRNVQAERFLRLMDDAAKVP